MAKTVAIGCQDFKKIITNNCFYIDKTYFIREWWESEDEVTLIARPRRFGKTLTMSMLDCFFSNQHAEDGKLFDGLSIWQEEKYRKLQGTYPVISLSFADVKSDTYEKARSQIYQILTNLYNDNIFLLDSGILTEEEQIYYKSVNPRMDETKAVSAIQNMSRFLSRYYGQKVLIFLDEYDTPMQEAYVCGFWDELTGFIRNLFNSTFKTNPSMERAIMTGITRVSKESIFSDLNNLKVITTTSKEYAASMGFTEQEVFSAMDEYGMCEQKEDAKKWYDGFTFGETTDIYNPWSILNLLDTGEFGTYWANTSSNSLVGKLIREGSADLKQKFENLLQGGTLKSEIDEQIVYNQLDGSEDAVWSLLLASGYLKVLRAGTIVDNGTDCYQTPYELTLTNLEVKLMFQRMIEGWFKGKNSFYSEFERALLIGDLETMNDYMNEMTLSIFSSFDSGNAPSRTAPERFFHGLVLGLLVNLRREYILTSNRESGFGRYDIMLEAKDKQDGIIIEFKVFNAHRDKSLEDTLQAALAQIEEKKYEQTLLDHGIAPEKIRKYGFAFQGKEVLIG